MFKKMFSRCEINTKEFYKFITGKYYTNKEGKQVKRDELLNEKTIQWCKDAFLNKLRPMVTNNKVPTMEEVTTFFSRYMTDNEKAMNKVYLRTFKLKIDTFEKFSQSDLYTIGAYLDK